jgi:hypothetical protein
MNFNLTDSYEQRKKVILGMVDSGLPGIAVISAASDLEWTLRRAIIALGKSPNRDIRKKIEKASGLRVYAKHWNAEVGVRFSQSLELLIADWDNFVDKTYKLRHNLVHGEIPNTTREYATPRVEEILRATKSIIDFADRNGIDIYMRLPVRRNTWVQK